ncbi:MAG: glycosyltransferase family 47 protein [Prosthecobacter sp.]|uniref:exostosin domain-containing protein n=1 Tax=Prosthecobacter sp. TaxID=1965333 RepID=UPI0025E68D61|nr:exostosin family protein [Prosthecobacter sp.]MCF7785942.1 glycosyltransferase family 47 protein [Prosthecobacter sp.]
MKKDRLSFHTVSAYNRKDSAQRLFQWPMFENIGRWTHVEDPAQADLILFAETFAGLDPYFVDVVRHPVFRAHRQKCVLYHIGDSTLTFCRTVSPSIDRNHPNVHARRSFSYLFRVHDNPFLCEISEAVIAKSERTYLFSFVGDPQTHPVRKRLLNLSHPEALLKTATGSSATFMADVERKPFQKDYLQTILDSDFVLCPRGLGPTSMRLFEVMQLGRAPVIISDEWLPVSGIPWEDFALFVTESEVGQISRLLEQNRDRAVAMGKRAREVWLEHFSPQRAVEDLLERALELTWIRVTARERMMDLLTLLPPRHWRILAACLRRILLQGSCAGNAPT